MGQAFGPVPHSCSGVFAGQRAVQFDLVDDDQRDRAAELHPQLVADADVRRVGDADQQMIVVIREEADRDRVEVARVARGEQLDCLGVDLGRVEVDELEVVLLGERAGDRRGLDPAPLDEELTEPEAGALLVDQCGLELLVGDETLPHEESAEREPCRFLCGRHALAVSAVNAWALTPIVRGMSSDAPLTM